MLQPDQKNGARIYVVRDGCALRWPNGQHRGSAGYAVRSDDPTVAAYFRNGEPANMRPAREDEDARPDPASKWPALYRDQAPAPLKDPAYMADVAKAKAKEDAKTKAKEEREERSETKRRKATEGLPEPDEPIGKEGPF